MEQPQSTSNVHSLDDVFAIPLKAVIDANTYAIKRALEFLLTFGFDGPVAKLNAADASIGNLRTVTFAYDYTDSGGQTRVTKVSIPLISLIPMPLLEVTKAQFDFAIQILHGETRTTSHAPDDSMMEHKSVLAVFALMDTTKEHQQGPARQPGPKANMVVHVEVEKSDLPAGILQLLNLSQQAIRGVMEEKLVIHTELDRLLFDRNDVPASQRPYKVRVEIRRPVRPGTSSIGHTHDLKASSGEVVLNKEIQMDVFSNAGRLADLFTRPMTIGTGYVIGVPTYSKAAALTNEDGFVEFVLWPDLSVSNNHNGFMVIKTKMTDDKMLYFGFI